MAIKDLIGSSRKSHAVLEDVDLVASVDSVVGIQGETGTGTGVIARSIHEASCRRNSRFVSVNCAAIPGDLSLELQPKASPRPSGKTVERLGSNPERL